MTTHINLNTTWVGTPRPTHYWVEVENAWYGSPYRELVPVDQYATRGPQIRAEYPGENSRSPVRVAPDGTITPVPSGLSRSRSELGRLI